MELIIQDFIDYLESKQVSKNTLLSYKRDINQLYTYLDQVGKKMFEATEEDLTSYIAYMQALEKSNATISRNIASMKAFYRYLLKIKLVEKNIADKLTSPKVEKKELSILSVSEVENLLEQPNVNDLKGQRDKAMLEVLYATGIRVTELISLNLR